MHKILTIPILPFGLINAFLIKSELGAILVDTGLPKTEKKLEKILKINNMKMSDIKLIVITHAHVDHAGNASLLRKLTNAKILAHENDLKYYERKELMSFCSSGWFGKIFLKTNLMDEPYEAFTPDIMISGSHTFDLKSFGINGRVVSTPGHTEGSLSIVLENNVAIVGDLISSGILLGGIINTSKAKSPPFEDNPNLVAKQLLNITDMGSKTFLMGHGGPLKAEEVKRHAAILMNKSANSSLISN